jgi:hypothetical protein
MKFDAAIAGGLLSRRHAGHSQRIALVLAAVAFSLVVAAWIADFDLTARTSAALLGKTDRVASFEDRFFSASMTASVADSALQPSDRSALAITGMKIPTVQSLIAPASMSHDDRAAFADIDARIVETRPPVGAGVPLPR